MDPAKEGLEDAAIDFCKRQQFEYCGTAGGGAFKTVFKAITPQANLIALKLLRTRSPRTSREVEAIRRCSHPHIATLHEAGTFTFRETEIDYTVEEFLPGGSLADRISQMRVSRQEAITLGSALIQALAHIRPLGIVHRDIKPANIVYRSDNVTPVLVDFGLVRDLTSSSLTQTWLSMGPGTPLFAPPEQLNNNKELIDWRSDQFSLGVTISLAFLGIHPYQYPNEIEITEQVVNRVASRQRPRPDFESLCATHGVQCLPRMVSPWPIGRVRKPEELSRMWSEQQEV